MWLLGAPQSRAFDVEIDDCPLAVAAAFIDNRRTQRLALAGKARFAIPQRNLHFQRRQRFRRGLDAKFDLQLRIAISRIELRG